MKNSVLKSYGSSLVLIASLVIGSVLGLILKERASILKPLGDIFLNMLFTIVVPLVFFSIASAVAGITNTRRLGSILGVMMIFFTATGIIASLLMIAGVIAFNPALPPTRFASSDASPGRPCLPPVNDR
jgi:Na+/H+-dicarboxylate symporter